MSEKNVVQKDQFSTLKGRAVAGLLGEKSAKILADKYVDLKVSGEHFLTSKGRANHAEIRRYKNLYAGQRCVIIGNGPSLRNTNLELLRNEITFGLNRIYLMFDELGFETSHHVVVNELVVEQCADDFRKIKSPLFTTLENRPHLEGCSHVRYLTGLGGPRFVGNVAHGIWVGGTVTYVALQLAYYMGFAKVILVGVDHRFADKGPANKVVVSAGPDQNHFDPRYFGAGFKWQLPDLETSEVAYELARRKFQASGRLVVDSTVDGALSIFPKVSLEEALGN
jgi:hypothetical protein